MRTVLSSLVLSALALGLTGEVRAGVLSDVVGTLPAPSFSLNCLEPSGNDGPDHAAAPVPRERREALPANDQTASMDAERARTDDPAMPSAADSATEKNSRGRPTRWKAMLPGALK
jgi:hypothetical protein